MTNQYKELIEQTLKMPVLQYEECYIAFTRILLAKIKKEKIILVYDSPRRLYEIKRYLMSLDIDYEKEILVEDLENPLVSFHKLKNVVNGVQNDIEAKYLFVSAVSFDQCWWMSKLPKKIAFYIHFKKYKECRDMAKKMLYFSPIYFRERGQEIYEYLIENVNEFANLFENLADNKSKDTLREILEVAVTNGIWSQPQGNQLSKYWECYKHLDDECLVNCGSAIGDTILKYLYSGYEFERIYAYEGNLSTFCNLKKLIEKIPKEITDKITPINEFLGVEGDAYNFDNQFRGKKVTLINMDIEGAEMAVLRGARNLIKDQRPVLAICAYHEPSHLLDIPKLVAETADNYAFYLRKYIGYEPGALNEYLYYCVPQERMLMEND